MVTDSLVGIVMVAEDILVIACDRDCAVAPLHSMQRAIPVMMGSQRPAQVNQCHSARLSHAWLRMGQQSCCGKQSGDGDRDRALAPCGKRKGAMPYTRGSKLPAA